MTQHRKQSWYDKKWKNRRALKNRARRAEKYREHSGSAAVQSVQVEDQEELQSPELPIGTVAEVQKSYCIILHENNYIRCRVENALLLEEESLVVGDSVAFDLIGDEEGIIHHILPRRSKLVRMRQDRTRRSEFSKEEHVLAANVDVAVIVASAASPPFHPRLVDRYLVMCQYGNVSPVICINKCDLVSEPPKLETYKKMGIAVIYVSVATGQGMDDLRALLHGKISVLTGQSGVGKSSIINWLLGKELLRVGEVGGNHGRGRHTTTVSTLHRLDETSYLIDTPGIRSLGLWEVDKETLRFYFPEFDEYAPYCKFRDCLHVSEPGCAVKEAVAEGKISQERYESYLRMMQE